MLMNKQELRDRGKESIDRFSSLSLVNPRSAIELELDFWEQEIFPLCDACGVSKYQFVIDEILSKVGFVGLTTGKLRDTVRRVRNKRAANRVSSPPEQAHRPITTPIAIREPVAPLVTPQVPARPVSLPGGVAEPVKVDWQWKEVIERLDSEPMDALWTEQDAKLWSYMTQEARKFHIDIEKDYHGFYRVVNGGMTKEVLMKLNRKRTSLIKEGFVL